MGRILHNTVEWGEYAKFFAGLLSIVNPVGLILIFINLTTNQEPAGQHPPVKAVAAGQATQ